MGSRYSNRALFKNKDESYESILEDRGVPFIKHYGSSAMMTPTPFQRSKLSRTRHIWKVGDRFYKLAIQYYGDAQYWWVIGLYNEKPTEAHLNVGDVIIIPLPLRETLRVVRG